MNRKRILFRILQILGVTVAICVIAAFFVARSSWFHRKVLALIVEKAQTSTGGRLQVQSWDWRFRPLTVDLYGIVLHGSEPPEAKPLLEVDKLTVGVSARSLFHRELHLSEIVIHHPVASISVAASGASNIPQPPPSTTKSDVTIWNLAVGHASVTNGDIYYNDRKIPVIADLYGLRTEVSFDSSSTRYSGMIAYHDGRLQYENYSPLPHALKMEFGATPAGIDLKSLQLNVGASQISVRGTLANYQKPSVAAAFQVLLHTQDFASMVQGVSPAGDVQTTGEFRYQYADDQPFLRTLQVEGKVASNELHATSQQGEMTVRDLRANYQLAHGALDVKDVAAGILDGELKANVGLRNLDATPSGILHVSLSRASIQTARYSVKKADVRRMPVTGTVEAKVDGSWSGSVKNIRLLGDALLRAAVWKTSSSPPTATPVDGAIHFSYDGTHNNLTLHKTTLQIPSTSITLNGQVGDHSNLQVQAIAKDLHELTKLLSSLQSTGSDSKEIEISGGARLDAVVQGSIQKPHFSGTLTANNLQAQGSAWKSATLSLDANPSEFKITQGSLVNAKQGNLSFNADIRLKNWSYIPSEQIRASLDARDLSIAELERLANQTYPVSGNLSANLVLQGSELHPSGHGSIRILKASVYEEAIESLAVQFQGTNDTIDSTLNANLPAGSLSAKIAYTPGSKAFNVDLHTSGIVLQKLHTVQAKNLPLQGVLTASVNGSGTVDNPQLEAQIGIPTLQVRQTTVRNMNAHLNVANQQANVSLTSDVSAAFIKAQATIGLTGNYETRATIDTNKVPLDPFLAMYAPSVPSDFHGESELHATLEGPLKDRSQLVAHVTIPTLSGTYQSLQFANASPIRADYVNSVVTIPPVEIRGTETSLHFQGRVPLQGNENMTLQANGDVSLRLLAMFNADLKSAGSIEFDVNGGGTVRKPDLKGQIRLKNAAVSTSSAPVGLSKLNGTLDVTSERVEIASLTGEVGGGTISAGGSVTYRPNLQFNVALQGKSVRLLYPDGVRTVLDSNLTFTGDMQSAALKGRALVDSLNFTPDFDLSSFSGQFNGPSVPPMGQSFADNVALAISIQSAQSLAARSSQLNLEGAANLQLVGTAADPVITGRVDLTSGELFFMNNRYQLQRGIVTFDNPNQTHPVLNIQATTTIEQYNLTLTLTGPIDRLSTNYVSDPSLPTADIISLVYRGQTTEEAAAAGTSTDSFLAGQAASQFSGSIQKLAGLSSLQIDPLLGGNNTNPSARIAIQQRVTKDFLFTFSTDVTQPQAQIVQGEYQITKRWSVSVERDQLGGVSVDGRLHTRF